MVRFDRDLEIMRANDPIAIAFPEDRNLAFGELAKLFSRRNGDRAVSDDDAIFAAGGGGLRAGRGIAGDVNVFVVERDRTWRIVRRRLRPDARRGEGERA